MSSSSAAYSRLGYMAIKQESVENTAVIPNTFVPIIKEDIVPKYDVSVSMPIAANRTINLTGVPNAIPAPSGKITVNVEPETIGYLLKGVYGTSSDGRYLPFSSSTHTFVVGEIVTGLTSNASATVVVYSGENDYALTSAWSGTFVLGETVTGSISGTGAVGTVATSTVVYGHQYIAPQTTLPTFTVEFGYLNEAVRFTGARLHEMNMMQKKNIIVGEFTLTARAEFKHARITAITTSGANKTITVDQTTGLVQGDTVKLFRPSLGAYQDFGASGTLTQTCSAVVSETSITVNNLQTTTAVGDLICLAPQTTSYNTKQEFTWVGGTTLRTGDGVLTATMVATAESIEDFEISLANDLEERHAANGANIVNRFPSNIYTKGLKGNGKLHRVYIDMTWLDRLRTNRVMTYQQVHNALAIGATSTNYTLDFRCPRFILDAFNPILQEDALLDQQMPYTMFYNSTNGYYHKAFLVNDVASY